MQLRGWRLTRASRIVIFLLVVQLLGLGVLAAPAIVAGGGVTASTPAIPVLDAVVSSVVTVEPHLLGSVALGGPDSRTALPAPVPLPRRLPRAPPAA